MTHRSHVHRRRDPVEVRSRARQLIDAARGHGGQGQMGRAGERCTGRSSFWATSTCWRCRRSAQAVARSGRRLPPFDVEARGAGAFPDLGPAAHRLDRRRRQGSEEMIALHDAIERELADVGFPRGGPPISAAPDDRPRPRRRGQAPSELGRPAARNNADFEGGLSTCRRGRRLFQRAGSRRPDLRAAWPRRAATVLTAC